MKRLTSLLIALVVFASVSAAFADTYLFGYTPGGALGGGLRFDLQPGVCVDLSAGGGSGASGSTYNLYADIFWGNWGVGVLAKKATVNADLAYDISLQYAVEKAINNDVVVGVAFTLVNYDTTSGADPNVTFLPSIAPYFVLPL